MSAHRTPDLLYRYAEEAAGSRDPGHRRRRRRSGASARDARRQDDPAGHRRPDPDPAPRRPRLAAVDRPDATRRAGRDRGHRQRRERRPARRRDPGPVGPRAGRAGGRLSGRPDPGRSSTTSRTGTDRRRQPGAIFVTTNCARHRATILVFDGPGSCPGAQAADLQVVAAGSSKWPVTRHVAAEVRAERTGRRADVGDRASPERWRDPDDQPGVLVLASASASGWRMTPIQSSASQAGVIFEPLVPPRPSVVGT